MKTSSGFLTIFLISIAFVSCEISSSRSQSDYSNPPRVEQKAKALIAHGHTRIDNYYWLNERENPDVIAYLNAENEYLAEVMSETKDLQDSLYKEIVDRIPQNDESVPYLKNGYYYYSRFVEGGEYPIHCRKSDAAGAKEEVLLDVNSMAKGYSYYAVSGLSVSPDNQLLAFGVDTVSRRKYTLYIKNLLTDEIYSDAISETTGGAAWANDNQTFFYTRKNPVTLRSERIFKHKLGNDPLADPVVFYEEDETFSTRVSRSKSGEYILISSSSTLSSEYRFLRADTPDKEFTVFQPRERNLEYSIDHYQNDFYIITNLEASNFKLMKTPVTMTSKDHWTDLIPHREDVFLSGFVVFNDYLVLDERKNGIPRIRIIGQKDQSDHYIQF